MGPVVRTDGCEHPHVETWWRLQVPLHRLGWVNPKEEAIDHKEATSQVQEGDCSPGWAENPKEDVPLRK